MPLRMPRRAGMLLQTGQTTCYVIGDDGDVEAGLGKRYTVLSAGQYSGTSNIDVASYAAATISFVNATSKIQDAANGLAHIATGDTIVVKGSTDNDGTYTVATGGVAGEVVVSETLTDEAAGAVVSLYKRTTHSNNCVQDLVTGRMWSRYTSNGEKVGPNSNGTLVWYDATLVFTLHGAGADLQMIAPGTLRIVGGAGEVNAYHEGDLLDCAGFAQATNNLPNLYVSSVDVNGADLDIAVDSGKQTLVSEAAGGARSIGLVCQNIFNYAAGAKLGSLAGYTDWQAPNCVELHSLVDLEAPNAVPDAAAFPGWPAVQIWSGSLDAAGQGMYVHFATGLMLGNAVSVSYRAALVRDQA